MKKKLHFKKSLKIRSNDPDYLLVFDPEQDFFHEFNSTAAVLFAEFHAGLDEDEVVGEIMGKYDIDLATAKKETSGFRKKLIKMGIAYEK